VVEVVEAVEEAAEAAVAVPMNRSAQFHPGGYLALLYCRLRRSKWFWYRHCFGRQKHL
jgi:hypothetical protein